MEKIYLILPLLFYLIVTFLILLKLKQVKNKSDDFAKEYFIGNRSLNGFVLAMTVVSTYIGASSFISGPSVVNRYGLSWVLLACTQIPVVFLTLGVLGKKLGIIARKIDAITIMDILRARYKSDKLILLISVLTVLFLISSTVSQFIGGAKLLETIIGIPYFYAITIFVLFIILYTSLGGFRAITITDSIQTIIMIIAIIVIFTTLAIKQGGLSEITRKVYEIDPNLLTPNSGGNLKEQYIMSFFVLVGIGILGLPAITIRNIAFKSTKGLHNSIILGSITIGIIIIGMHLIGYMSIPLYPKSTLGDNLIPEIAKNNLHPILMGIFIGGPLVAIMSSVDSILILITSTIIKDIYVEYYDKNISKEKLKRISVISSFIIGIIVYIIALRPFDLIVWINLFSLSGQEIIFFIPMMMGLFYKRANTYGVFASIISGIITMLVLTIYKINILGLHYIIPSLFVSLIFFFIFNEINYKEDKEIEEIFFE